MVRNGKNAVLMRDMTDALYNPKRWPFVSQYTGTDLIVAHIERHVCPTITSDQLIGGRPFRFAGDRRPHLAIVMAEVEYKTNRTLPKKQRHRTSKIRPTINQGAREGVLIVVCAIMVGSCCGSKNAVALMFT